MKDYEEETRKLYDNIEKIWPDNNYWYDYTHNKIIDFINSNKNIFSADSIILNAGSGGSVYKEIEGDFYHVDISDKFIKKFPNHFVASIEKLPFQNQFFDSIICVGSVINYCNALTAISEMNRVLKDRSCFILEYERSQTGELLLKKEYGQSVSRQIYQYNNQSNHKLWLYSDAYIDNILLSMGFKIIKNEYYHAASSLLNRFMNNELKAGKFAKCDVYIPLYLRKKLAHNRILLAYKNS